MTSWVLGKPPSKVKRSKRKKGMDDEDFDDEEDEECCDQLADQLTREGAGRGGARQE